MRKVTRIDVVHFARFQAVLFALVGFLSGILYSFGGAIYDLYSSGTVNSGTGLAFLALIGMPIIFSAFGFILGLVEAYLFNLTAKWIGGINLDFLPK
jgi:hypothetical protein